MIQHTLRDNPFPVDLSFPPGQNTVMVGFLIWDFDGTLGYREGKASFSEQRGARLGFFEHLGVRLSPREPDEAFQDIGPVRSRTIKPWRNHLLAWNVWRFILGR